MSYMQEYLLSHSLVLVVVEGHSGMSMMMQHVLIYHHHFCLDQLLSPLHMYANCFLFPICSHLLFFVQISSNGLISFGVRFTDFSPQTFPISVNVVAPYWTDINLATKGIVRYDVVTRSHPMLSCLLEQTNDLIREQENVMFDASWLLVARWIDACPIGNSNCDEVCKIISCHRCVQKMYCT